MVLGPVTAAVYLFYAFSMTLYHQLRGTPPVFWVVAFFIGLPFMIIDVLYNWTVGTILFVEFPRELLYTSRLQRHKTYGSEFAASCCQILNRWDEGHC